MAPVTALVPGSSTPGYEEGICRGAASVCSTTTSSGLPLCITVQPGTAALLLGQGAATPQWALAANLAGNWDLGLM